MRPLLFALLFLSSLHSQSIPETPVRPWQPGGVSYVPSPAAYPPQEAEMDHGHVYSLGDLIDIAQMHNPATRSAWAQAKARAAAVGIAKSELYPTLVVAAAARTFQEPLLLYEQFQLQDLGLFESLLQMHYTILDFGARQSEIRAARARQIAANFRFNDAHLQVINQVTQAYYGLQNAVGLHEAALANRKDAQAVREAAEERLRNGLATLPDVLEARAAAAKAEYELQSAIRTEKVFFGDLASALTVPPSRSFRVQALKDLLIPDSLPVTLEEAGHRALRQRPDLLAGMANIQAADAELKHARSAWFPKLTFEGDTGWIRAWGQQENLPSIYGQVKIYDARVNLKWTIFDGLRREKEIARATAEQQAARAEVHEKQDRIASEVWTAYQNAETSLQQRKAAVALLRASAESYNAALEAYRYGVRNILDVLAAERELAQARAVDVTARTQVLNTIKDLAFRTGDLLTNHPTGARP
ncbi:MAG TPA: TolC family protein [Bryobacteraceae bacterium]|nr:TolC family protein [Bryobacteraceae bacterium]